MTTRIGSHLASDDLEWRSPTNLKNGITNGEPARVRWPASAEKPLADFEVPWKYGYLVWDYWIPVGGPPLQRGKVRFLYEHDRDIEMDSPGQCQVQRPKKGLGR